MVVLFGGSFDPIHLGHLLLIQNVIKKFQPDKFIVMPAYNGMHKHKSTFTGEFRLKLITKALSALPTTITKNIEISDFELRQNRPVYTYETIEKLRPDTLLIGSDLNYTKWRKFKEIIDAYIKQVLIYPRNTSAQHIHTNKEIVLSMPLLDISSSEIVKRLSLGKSIKDYAPDSILNFIEEEYLLNNCDDSIRNCKVEPTYC